MTKKINWTDTFLKDNTSFKNIIASGYINFLFGAGVNGSSFPNFRSGFNETKDILKESGKNGENIENELSDLDESNYDKATAVLVNEYNKHSLSIDLESEPIINLKNLLNSVYILIDKAENRQPYMKKINIFTLNYDRIVENVLDESGYLFRSITSDKLHRISTYDTIGYDTSAKKFIPAFAISKLHGSVNANNKLVERDIILPSRNKLRQALSNSFFSTLFKMKSELEKRNAVLFIIGYSGADDDINNVLRDSISKGLTVYWLKYSDSDDGMENLKLNMNKIWRGKIDPTKVNGAFQDSTKTLCDILNKVRTL